MVQRVCKCRVTLACIDVGERSAVDDKLGLSVFDDSFQFASACEISTDHSRAPAVVRPGPRPLVNHDLAGRVR